MHILRSTMQKFRRNSTYGTRDWIRENSSENLFCVEKWWVFSRRNVFLGFLIFSMSVLCRSLYKNDALSWHTDGTYICYLVQYLPYRCNLVLLALSTVQYVHPRTQPSQPTVAYCTTYRLVPVLLEHLPQAGNESSDLFPFRLSLATITSASSAGWWHRVWMECADAVTSANTNIIQSACKWLLVAWSTNALSAGTNFPHGVTGRIWMQESFFSSNCRIAST